MLYPSQSPLFEYMWSQMAEWWRGEERGRRRLERLSSRKNSSYSPNSLKNNAGSPFGSRAASIASDRGRRSVNVQLRRRSLDDASNKIPWIWDADFLLTGRSLGDASPANEFRWMRRPTLPPSQFSAESLREPWATHAITRPVAEPPILDFRKFDDGGSMYDSIHRHPETKPEDWYEYTDAEVEVELLGDYHDWINDTREEAATSGNGARMAFYQNLLREVDIDRQEPHDDLLSIKDRIFNERQARKAARRTAGKRVQAQFDEVRKLWRDVDSSDSDWDEQEWEIFAPPSSRLQKLVDEADDRDILGSRHLARSASRPIPIRELDEPGFSGDCGNSVVLTRHFKHQSPSQSPKASAATYFAIEDNDVFGKRSSTPNEAQPLLAEDQHPRCASQDSSEDDFDASSALFCFRCCFCL